MPNAALPCALTAPAWPQQAAPYLGSGSGSSSAIAAIRSAEGVTAAAPGVRPDAGMHDCWRSSPSASNGSGAGHEGDESSLVRAPALSWHGVSPAVVPKAGFAAVNAPYSNGATVTSEREHCGEVMGEYVMYRFR